VALTPETLTGLWPAIRQQLSPSLAATLKPAIPAISGPNCLEIQFPNDYNANRNHFRDQDGVNRLTELLRGLTDQTWTVRLALSEAPPGKAPPANSPEAPGRAGQREEQALQKDLVKRARDVLKASIVRVDEDFGSAPGGNAAAGGPETTDEEES
jgi:hypothetical protein